MQKSPNGAKHAPRLQRARRNTPLPINSSRTLNPTSPKRRLRSKLRKRRSPTAKPRKLSWPKRKRNSTDSTPRLLNVARRVRRWPRVRRSSTQRTSSFRTSSPRSRRPRRQSKPRKRRSRSRDYSSCSPMRREIILKQSATRNTLPPDRSARAGIVRPASDDSRSYPRAPRVGRVR